MPAYQGEHEDVLRPFFDAMRYKLANNKHRGKRRWEELDVGELLKHLEHEVQELKEAIASGNMTEIMMEAADIGNFAMMVQAVAIRNAHNGWNTEKPRPSWVAPVVSTQVRRCEWCQAEYPHHAFGCIEQ